MADLGLAPSEVRQMTLGEIYSVVWARTRDSEQSKREEAHARMYKLLKKIKGDK